MSTGKPELYPCAFREPYLSVCGCLMSTSFYIKPSLNTW